MGNGVSLERRRGIADFTSPCHEHIDGVSRQWSSILAGTVSGGTRRHGKWCGIEAWSGAFGGNTHPFDIGSFCHSRRNLEKSPAGCLCHGVGRMLLRRRAGWTDILFCGGRGGKCHGAGHFPAGAERGRSAVCSETNGGVEPGGNFIGASDTGRRVDGCGTDGTAFFAGQAFSCADGVVFAHCRMAGRRWRRCGSRGTYGISACCLWCGESATFCGAGVRWIVGWMPERCWKAVRWAGFLDDGGAVQFLRRTCLCQQGTASLAGSRRLGVFVPAQKDIGRCWWTLAGKRGKRPVYPDAGNGGGTLAGVRESLSWSGEGIRRRRRNEKTGDFRSGGYGGGEGLPKLRHGTLLLG